MNAVRRVVITGLGAVTPIGNDVPAFWEGLKTGKNGIGPVTRFDVTDYKAKLAAEVKDFDPALYMEKPRSGKPISLPNMPWPLLFRP